MGYFTAGAATITTTTTTEQTYTWCVADEVMNETTKVDANVIQ